MSFDHYYRNGTRMLRCGYTTGTCAALAAAAATELLLTGSAPEEVSLVTRKGIPVEVPVERTGINGDRAWVAITKDAGDDADVTDGIEIVATAQETGMNQGTANPESGKDEDAAQSADPADAATERTEPVTVLISGGEGVGRVTKPGLDQPVGEAAINSGPRTMIEEEVRKVCRKLGHRGGISVVISVPEGEKVAEKTFNASLGIEGGISILGTTGIVEPMSQQALVDTIEVTLHQLMLNSRRLILTPGNYGNTYIRKEGLDELEIPVLNISNFLGETLDMIGAAGSAQKPALEPAPEQGYEQASDHVRPKQVETVLLVAHVGKLAKVAAGVMNTHSKYADARNEVFCSHAAMEAGKGDLAREPMEAGDLAREPMEAGDLARKLMEAATTDACIQILDEYGKTNGLGQEFRNRVIGSILAAVQKKLEHRVAGAYRIGAVMFSNVYGTLGMTEAGEQILKEWKSESK